MAKLEKITDRDFDGLLHSIEEGILEGIRLCGIFRPPMDKDDDKIRLPAGLSQLCAYPFFIL